jgi:uncharacterized protein YkwD
MLDSRVRSVNRATLGVRLVGTTAILAAVGIAAAQVSHSPAAAPRPISAVAAPSLSNHDGHFRFTLLVANPEPAPTQTAGLPQAAAPATATTASRPTAAAPRPIARPKVAVNSGQQALINADRAAAGLPPLSWSPCLAAIALQNAERMAAQGYISHANGVSLDLGCHLGSRTGENIAYVSGGINDAVVNTMFMNSPEHRANILGAYHFVGTAWAVAPNGYAYIAVEFG